MTTRKDDFETILYHGPEDGSPAARKAIAQLIINQVDCLNDDLEYLNDATFQAESAMTVLSGILTCRRLTLLALLTFSLLSGCARIRLLTYPPEFTYLDSNTAKGVMHEMAINLSALDGLVQQAAENSDNVRYQPLILAQLQNIETLATSISSGTTGKTVEGDARPMTNHLIIDEHIDEFIAQIMRAKLLTEAEPPNFYGAGQLTGSCNACHRMR